VKALRSHLRVEIDLKVAAIDELKCSLLLPENAIN